MFSVWGFRDGREWRSRFLGTTIGDLKGLS